MKQQWIPNFCGIRPELLKRHARIDKKLSWLPNGSLLTSGARHALYQGCFALGLKKGDGILSPGFTCNTVTLPLEKAGMKVYFFNLNRDLSIDWEDLIKTFKKNKNIKALTWYHYLGIPMEFEKIKNFCKEHRLFLIEDCAHSLFTQINGRDCGKDGDIAVFSIQKMIPVLHAGALVINNPKYQLKNMPKILKLNNSQLKNLNQIELVRHQFFAQSQNTHINLLRINFRDYAKIAKFNQNKYDKVYELDEVTKTIMLNVEPQKIRSIRARNFNLYLKNLKEFSVFASLPASVCPLAFPFWSKERDQLRKRMEEKGVDALTYWPDWILPKGVIKKYPDAKYLADSILCLPCHQDLGESEINYVCKIVKECV